MELDETAMEGGGGGGGEALTKASAALGAGTLKSLYTVGDRRWRVALGEKLPTAGEYSNVLQINFPSPVRDVISLNCRSVATA